MESVLPASRGSKGLHYMEELSMKVVDTRHSATPISSERFLPANWMKLVPMTKLYIPLYNALVEASLGKSGRMLYEENDESN